MMHAHRRVRGPRRVVIALHVVMLQGAEGLGHLASKL